jgi:hypothetical protein
MHFSVLLDDMTGHKLLRGMFSLSLIQNFLLCAQQTRVQCTRIAVTDNRFIFTDKSQLPANQRNDCCKL